MTAIRVALVDDHPIVLQGLRLLFERQPDFTVLASFTDTESALAGVRSNMPDVLVLDLRMRGQSGLDLLRMMAGEHLACRSVLLTANILDEELVEAMKLGVTGVVLKESPTDALLDCIRQVHKGPPVDRSRHGVARIAIGPSTSGPGPARRGSADAARARDRANGR